MCSLDDAFDFAIEDASFFTLGLIHSFDEKIELIADAGYKTKETDIFLKANQEFRNTIHANLYFSPQFKMNF